METNPFFLTNVIPDEYFCDRKTESEKLLKAMHNQENVVITASRRVGKTGLINHCFRFPEIAQHYYVISIDILHTSSLNEFVQELGNATFRTVAKRSARLAKKFATTLKSLTASFGFDPVTGGPSFDVKLGEIVKPDYTLDEIFEYLESADKPVIVAMDEFQQISNYSEKNIEELLRGKIQKMSNVHFIFAGSSRRLMTQMFFSSKRAFYQSAISIELEPIEKSIYTDFAVEKFVKAGRQIDATAVLYAYERFKGITMHVHRVLHDAFAECVQGDICTAEEMERICEEYITECGSRLKELLRTITPQQKELLYAISREGNATGITSGNFIKKHSLKSASAVQSAAKQLLSNDIISKVGNTFTVSDPIMDIWLNGDTTSC